MANLVHHYIVDEEDGPAVGVVYDLPDGSQVWSGEISRALFEEQDSDAQDELGNDVGAFVVHSLNGDTAVLARAINNEAAMTLAHALAAYVAANGSDVVRG
jgi:hypothetical protein